jgi:L-cysteine:1D-myo-inositol 2-amino-2-deoxy-alpha-D-glucopyranoside ligase
LTLSSPRPTCPKTDRMRLFNTASGQMENVPDSGHLGLYVCGITPYAAAHIGHAMVYLTYDFLIRRLRDLGQEVAHVRNIADVDNSILEYAREHRMDYRQLGKSEYTRFACEMAQLNIHAPDREPRATQSVGSAVELIHELTARGLTYVLDGNVYFDTPCSGVSGNSRIIQIH